MRVYRYLSEEELKFILSGDTSRIGSICADGNKPNTHRYESDKRYLHFFLNEDNIKQVKFMHALSMQEQYCCAFDIPLITLIKHRGRGKYEVFKRGRVGYVRSITEFAIPVEEFDPSSLISYTRDDEHHDFLVRQRSVRESLTSKINKDIDGKEID